MSAEVDRAADQRLLDATLAYVAKHPDSKLDGFRDAVANWGHDWTGIAPVHLTASDLLAEALALTKPATGEQELMDHYVRERASRYWEQSYTSADKAVGDDMLTYYGYTEIVGKRGPFISERVRAGIGVFGANVNYPAHRHAAEEIYVILAGSADFRLGEGAGPERRTAGDVINIPSMLTHGFRMTDEPLVIFYLWQGGDLREKSSFV
ncbi:MAG: cupin domain-containing protein [Rhizobiales bacterium]|nr:cupin domain-containing protein [Hyphomicrobiales bacterium]